MAHITAERGLEADGIAEDEVLKSAYLCKAHRAFFGHLEEKDRMVEDRVVMPGAIREEDVQVFRHHGVLFRNFFCVPTRCLESGGGWILY